MRRRSFILIRIMFWLLVYGAAFVFFSDFSPILSVIAAVVLLLAFVFVVRFQHILSRHYKKFSIVETRQYGDRIIMIKGLDDGQRKGFLEEHMELYDEKEGYADWKPEVKVVDGIIYFLYPSTIGLFDFCNLYSFAISGESVPDSDGLELAGWYPMVEGHSEKQKIPFNNKTLMLFHTDYHEYEDFVYFVTEYNHVYKMDLGIARLKEVKDVQANYESMPDWNSLVSDI